MKYALSILIWLVMASPIVLGQQAKLKVSNEKPRPGETVVIEVNARAGNNTKLVWTKDGEGEFLTETENESRVQFRPSRPGDTVIIVCEISTPKGQDHPSTKLLVSGQAPAAAGKAASALQAPVASAPQIPRADLAITDMEYVVPSGYMGDAMADNNEAATLDVGYTTGCQVGPSCIRIEYKPKDGKVGWAAFAWQRVTEGSANWGESLGADYSHDRYLSLRVFAKGQPDEGENLPKVQFKSGGNVAPKFNSTNRATYAVAGPTVRLSSNWQDYCLSLENQDLTNTVSPFSAVVTKAGNPKGAVILLENIRFSRSPCR
jgi:hypothetical protein